MKVNMRNFIPTIQGFIKLRTLCLVLMWITLTLNAYGVLTIKDARSGLPLPKASIFDKNGAFIAVSNEDGTIPSSVNSQSFPINIRYVGYLPVELKTPADQDVLMYESTYQLPEVVVDDKSRNLLYILAFVRDYTTGYDANDTLVYYQEQIVDFVLPLTKKTKEKGWKKARILASREYDHVIKNRKDVQKDTFRYKENQNNKNGQTYSLNEKFEIPEQLISGDQTKVVIDGKYYPQETWTKIGDSYILYKDELADEKNHVYSPNALKVLGATADNTRNEAIFKFTPDSNGQIKPDKINEVAFFFDVTLKGKLWKMASKQKEPIVLSTYGELYVIDRAYLTAEEVKDLKKNPTVIDVNFKVPENIPEPPAEITDLKNKVLETIPNAK